MGTDLEARQAAELEELNALIAREAEASGTAKAALRDERIQTPMLAVVQGTTKHPPKDSKGGDFVNTVTGDVFGDTVQLLIAHFARGRFYGVLDDEGNPTDESYFAGEEAIVPQNWPEEFRGRVFAELPEAEEMWSFRANLPSEDPDHIDWGHGPLISTTFNFTGIVIDPVLTDDEDEPVAPMPVRLSLMRTGVPAARKAITMLKPLRNMWDKAITFSTERVVVPGQVYYKVNAEDYGRAPELVERAASIELALAAEQLGFRPVGNEDGEVGGSRPGDIEGTATEAEPEAAQF